MPVEPDLRRVRGVGADLDEPRAELRVEDVEVVDPDPALLAEVLEADDLPRAGAVAGGEHPLKLLAGDDRDHPEAPLAPGCLQKRTDMIELAIIPPRPIRLLQLQDRDPTLGRERLHLPA